MTAPHLEVEEGLRGRGLDAMVFSGNPSTVLVKGVLEDRHAAIVDQVREELTSVYGRNGRSVEITGSECHDARAGKTLQVDYKLIN